MKTQRKKFFFEKKNQKTFVFWVHAAGESRDSDKKVFCFFSSEKKALLLLIPGMQDKAVGLVHTQ
jgi:hypothetical protein